MSKVDEQQPAKKIRFEGSIISGATSLFFARASRHVIGGSGVRFFLSNLLT